MGSFPFMMSLSLVFGSTLLTPLLIINQQIKRIFLLIYTKFGVDFFQLCSKLRQRDRIKWNRGRDATFPGKQRHSGHLEQKSLLLYSHIILCRPGGSKIESKKNQSQHIYQKGRQTSSEVSTFQVVDHPSIETFQQHDDQQMCPAENFAVRVAPLIRQLSSSHDLAFNSTHSPEKSVHSSKVIFTLLLKCHSN